jgi:hypothetical protein
MNQDLKDLIETFADDPMIMDGYDDCIIGVIERFGQTNHVVYDYDLVIKKLMSEGMTEEEASEWYNFNMLGSYVGESTPAFIHKL